MARPSAGGCGLPLSSGRDRKDFLFRPAEVVSKDLEGAKRLQKELRAFLIPLTNWKKRPSLEEANSLIEKLVCNKVNEMDLKSAWVVRLNEHEGPMEGNIRAGKKRGLMPGQKTFSIPVVFPDGKTREAVWLIDPQTLDTHSVQKYIYGLAIRLLKDGELHRLRSCPQCQKFFVAEDRKREFCNESCRVKLGNKERLDSGYFTNLRHKKRRTALAVARRLAKEGKPLQEIMTATRLSERILKRAGFVDGQLNSGNLRLRCLVQTTCPRCADPLAS